MNSTQTNDQQSKAQAYFDIYPTAKMFYVTSDGQFFMIENRAVSHSAKLKDKTITEVWHPDLSKGEIESIKGAAVAAEQAARDEVFKSTFPELAASIIVNQNRGK